MSLNCNGVRKHSKSRAKNGKRRFSVDAAAAKSYEAEDAFRGFAKCPVVCVTRADISSYLKGMSQKSAEKTPVHKSLSKLELAVHSRNLAAKCSVGLLREDLESLKMAFQKDPDNPIFKTTFNLAKLKCKICDKVYSSEKKLQNHQENKHIIYKPNEKTPKRVSFADHVTVHEVKEYHKCRKCTRIFEHYKLLKLHMKVKHKKHMLQHKWTHFLKTSDNSQLRPKDGKLELPFKRIFKADEKVPDYMQPKVILEKIKVGGNELTDKIDLVDDNGLNEIIGEIKKPIVNPVSKKTIFSKHQCQTCDKYFSTNYCLNRHIVTQHSDYETLKCKVCEETFVWPSLLTNHKCIRLNLPEIPFDDARPEIYFDNLHELRAFDDLPITDDYMNTVDFEIPAPIVELVEYEGQFGQRQNCYSGSKIVMQEVPIEF